MPIQRDNGDIRRRSLFWAFGLLALLGLAACGASDQRATTATPASASQTLAGTQQPLTETELDPPTPRAEPTSAPSTLPSPASPTAVDKPFPVPVPTETLNPSETLVSAAPALLATITAVTMRDNAWQTYRKIVFPLIGPGVSAGLLLSFIIVFNEYLVTLFVHPVDIETAPLRIFNLQKTGGLSPATAALAVTMQLVSFAAVLLFFRVFGTRHFKGTYIL